MLSFSENLWSIRTVSKFSLLVEVLDVLKSPVSPFPIMPELGKGQKGRYGATNGLTITLVGVQLGVTPVGIEQRFPARAFCEGTLSTLVAPSTSRIPS